MRNILFLLMALPFIFTGCSDDDDNGVKTGKFPSEGITLTLGVDDLETKSGGNSIEHTCIYELGYYMETDYSQYNIEVLNKDDYSIYISAGVSWNDNGKIGSKYYHSELKIIIHTKIDDGASIAKKEITKHPVKVKITWSNPYE